MKFIMNRWSIKEDTNKYFFLIFNIGNYFYLCWQQKYFDSGDYQMAKQKPTTKARQAPAVLGYATGDAIPTPETVPVRKTSIIQPTKFTSSSTT